MDFIIDIDTWLLLTLNGINHEYVDPVMRALSRSHYWVWMYVAVAAVIWWRFGWRRAVFIVLCAALAVGASDYLCASVIRPVVQRLRPSNLDNEISALVHIVDGYRSGLYGFPSCHAANTFALAVFTSLVMRRRLYVCFIFAWALLQCYSRVYLGVHYPGDLAVGALLGSGIAYLVYLVCRRYVPLTSDLNTKASSWPAVIVCLLTCLYIVVKVSFC